MVEITSKRARLRAIQHLLEYAAIEVQDLGLHQLQQLLAAATATVNAEIRGKSRSRPITPTPIRLVANAGSYEKGNGTKGQ
jgi:hypothetical protein